ncbi:MAG: acetate uptake transporter [Frankia sp.]
MTDTYSAETPTLNEAPTRTTDTVRAAGGDWPGSLADERLRAAEWQATLAAGQAPVPDRHVPDPGPLGLAAFALTTFVLSLTNAGVFAAEPAAVALAFFYGGAAQLLAGLWEFRRANVFGATAFTSYGAFWLSYGIYALFIAKSLNASGDATATFLLGWTIFTAYMTIAAVRVSNAVFVVFVLLTITFVLLTVGAYNPAATGSASGWTKAGGWTGVATAAAAWYGSFGGVVNATFRRRIIPT